MKTIRTTMMLTKRAISYMPQATVHSSLVAEAWLAWHSIHRSMMWFLGYTVYTVQCTRCTLYSAQSVVHNVYSAQICAVYTYTKLLFPVSSPVHRVHSAHYTVYCTDHYSLHRSNQLCSCFVVSVYVLDTTFKSQTKHTCVLG